MNKSSLLKSSSHNFSAAEEPHYDVVRWLVPNKIIFLQIHSDHLQVDEVDQAFQKIISYLNKVDHKVQLLVDSQYADKRLALGYLQILGLKSIKDMLNHRHMGDQGIINVKSSPAMALIKLAGVMGAKVTVYDSLEEAQESLLAKLKK